MNFSLRLCMMIALLAGLLSRTPPTGTGVICGTVTDISGKPISRASVLLFHPNEDKPVTTITTDKQGKFRTAPLPAGKWRLEWKAKGYFEKFERSGGPMFTRRIPTTVDSIPNDSQTVSLVMRKNAVLYGQVTDTDGKPITRQAVWLVAAHSNHGTPINPKVKCDSRGFYQLEFGEGREPGFGVYVPGKKEYAPFTEFQLEDGKRTRIDFRLVRGGRISGRVVAADGKTPVSGSWVRASYPSIKPTYPPFRGWVKKEPTNWQGMGEPQDFPGHPLIWKDVLVVEWQFDTLTNASGEFELPVNPDKEYSLFASTLLHYSDREPSLKVRVCDGEHHKGFTLILDHKIGGDTP